jgi:hypothetical protein
MMFDSRFLSISYASFPRSPFTFFRYGIWVEEPK